MRWESRGLGGLAAISVSGPKRIESDVSVRIFLSLLLAGAQ